MKEYNTVLTVAGSDSGGGAGIQADLKTITSLGCYGMSVITSLTAQNTIGVQAIEPISRDFVSQQFSSIVNDFSVKSIKIGMLHSTDIIDVVCEHLIKLEDIPIILDPVMVSTSRDILLKKEAIQSLKNKLFPLSTLVTPNVHEAEVLIGVPINSVRDMMLACEKIKELGVANVLVKGGDLESNESIDILLNSDNEFKEFGSRKIMTKNTHGTGCSFSSAIASNMSMGKTLENSISMAKTFITEAIMSGAKYKIGHGNGPINHMWRKSND